MIHNIEHKFRHNCNDTINPICNCSAPSERTLHYLLRCRLYSVPRAELFDGAYKLDSTLQNSVTKSFLHGSEKYALNVNKEIIRLFNSYLKASKCFVQPLFYQQHLSLFIYIFLFFNVWLYRAYCKRLYLTWVLSCFDHRLGSIFHTCCFIVGFIVSACKDP